MATLIQSIGSPGPSFKTDNRAKKIAVRLEWHKNKLEIKDDNDLLVGLDSSVFEAIEECMRENFQQKGGSIDSQKALKLSKDMEMYLEGKAMPAVKLLRTSIPRAVLLMFFTEDVCAGREKVKHLWSTQPDGWPDGIPFVDPNNASSGRKLQKDGLQKIHNFLKDFWQQNKERIKRRIEGVGPRSVSVQPPEPREPWKIKLKMLLHTAEKQLEETIHRYPQHEETLKELNGILGRLFKAVNHSPESRIKFSDVAHEVTQLMNRVQLREDMSPQDVDRCRKIIELSSGKTAKDLKDYTDFDHTSDYAGGDYPSAIDEGFDMLAHAMTMLAPAHIENTSMDSMEQLGVQPLSPAVEPDQTTDLGLKVGGDAFNDILWPGTVENMHNTITEVEAEATDQPIDAEKSMSTNFSFGEGKNTLEGYTDLDPCLLEILTMEYMDTDLGLLTLESPAQVPRLIKGVSSDLHGPATMLTCNKEDHSGGLTLSNVIPLTVIEMDTE